MLVPAPSIAPVDAGVTLRVNRDELDLLRQVLGAETLAGLGPKRFRTAQALYRRFDAVREQRRACQGSAA